MYGMTPPKKAARKTAAEKIREAEAARDKLKAALHSAGITLPSLNIEAADYADENPQPLLDLGSCNVQTARKLAAVLGAKPSKPTE